ncbi:MAG: hypothetical protein L3K23_10840 [Thermoplasmata archaeon]|nr:hypothetical protein [Thermoplasmata archaeon]
MSDSDDGDPRRFSDRQSQAYAARQIAAGTNSKDIAVAGITSASAVVRELITVAKANPIIGVVLAAIVVDVLDQAKVIRPQTSIFLFNCIGVAFDVTVAAEIVDIFGEINPFKSGGGSNSNSDLIKPVPTTIVENPPAAANASVPPGAMMGSGGSGATVGQVAGLIAAGA